jgi:ankyrin repeat protein
MAALSLPTNPSLEQMRKQARDLQRAVRAGDDTAIDRVAAVHPGGHRNDPATLPLSAAQLVVARSYGFPSWPRLVHYFDVVAVYGRPGGATRDGGATREGAGNPDGPAPAVADIADRFCRLACVDYSDDRPEYPAAARSILHTRPDLTRDHIWAAAAASDVDAMDGLLARDPSLSRREGGPYRWPPLCYVTYSRLDPAVAESSVLAVARALIDAGADPNSGYLWGGLPTPFTALTGAFGEGEQGPGRTPRHPHSIALARLLLDAGADPNDGQTLYNRMFRADDDHLELLLAYGLGRGDGGPGMARLGPDALDTPGEMLDKQLHWAVGHGFAGRVRLLARHGVDVGRPMPDGRRPIEVAAANGDEAMVAALVDAGARRPDLTGRTALVAALLAGDRARVDRIRAGQPGLLDTLLAAEPGLVVHATDVGRADAVPLLVELGFDVDALVDGATALHATAWDGDIATARMLLDLGADATLRDERFDATPQGWAEHAHQDAYVAFISEYTSAQR